MALQCCNVLSVVNSEDDYFSSVVSILYVKLDSARSTIELQCNKKCVP
jgi:hypothetical protein